jgi:hypothetical protein
MLLFTLTARQEHIYKETAASTHKKCADELIPTKRRQEHRIGKSEDVSVSSHKQTGTGAHVL